MIQDIAPHVFDNTYRIIPPRNEDYVLCIRKSRVILIARTPEEAPEPVPSANPETGVLGIPTIGEIRSLYPFAEQRTIYLFAIDEMRYFLIDIREEEDPHLPEGGRFVWKDSRFLRSMDPQYEAFAAITAVQLARWRESRRFCGHCGTPLVDSRKERALVCPKCGQTEYPKISPAIIVAVTNGDKLLMTRYRGRSYGGPALVAGFVEIGETFEDTVHREVMEETGLKVKNIRYFESQPWGFSDTEMVGFFADLDGDDTITVEEDELAEAGWYTRDEIPDDWRMTSISAKLRMAFKYGNKNA